MKCVPTARRQRGRHGEAWRVMGQGHRARGGAVTGNGVYGVKGPAQRAKEPPPALKAGQAGAKDYRDGPTLRVRDTGRAPGGQARGKGCMRKGGGETAPARRQARAPPARCVPRALLQQQPEFAPHVRLQHPCCRACPSRTVRA